LVQTVNPVATTIDYATGSASSSGDGQTGTVNADLSDLFSVKVTDNTGQPVTGFTVTWAIDAASPTGGSLTSVNATNGDGVASAQLHLGNAGNYVVTAGAAVPNGSPVTFHATANTPAPASIVYAGGTGQSDAPGEVLD